MPSVVKTLKDGLLQSFTAQFWDDGSGNVTPAKADGSDITQGSMADAAATNGTGSWSVIALLKALVSVLYAGGTTAGKGIVVMGRDNNTGFAQPLLATSGGALTTYGGGGLYSVVGQTGAGTNRSVTASTTAQNAMAANTSRRGWKIKNDTAVDVWINFDAAASAVAGGGNLKVAAGSYLASEPIFVESGAMSVIASSGTAAVTIREH